MKLFLTVVHVMTCIILVVVVLLQRGKGAEIGAVFGGGASSTVFGARGAGNFLTKLTTVAAVVFMVSSLTLSCLSTRELTPTLREAREVFQLIENHEPYCYEEMVALLKKWTSPADA